MVILTILKSKMERCRDFDVPQKVEEGNSDKLHPGEWIFIETADDSKCGPEVYIKYEGLKACILDQIALGTTETKLARKEVVAWLLAHGRYHNKDATVSRRRCAYVLPCSLVDNFEVFALRNRI